MEMIPTWCAESAPLDADEEITRAERLATVEALIVEIAEDPEHAGTSGDHAASLSLA